MPNRELILWELDFMTFYSGCLLESWPFPSLFIAALCEC